MTSRKAAAAGPLTTLTLALALALVFALGACAKPTPRPVTVVGEHRVRLMVPKGWEHLDHGRQHLFRLGEDEVSLTDAGVATRAAMVAEIRAALDQWRMGHGGDAFDRIRSLRCPALAMAAPDRARAFWRPWRELPDDADSARVAAAMLGLIASADSLPEVSAEQRLAYVQAQVGGMRDREIESNTVRSLHGIEWVDVVMWDRVSHEARTRVAFTVLRGRFLVLATGLGVYARQAPAFETVLTSLEPAEATAPR